MKRYTFGKLHFSNSSTVKPYLGSMCMPVAKMWTSKRGGSSSRVRISDISLPKSARVPERKTILRRSALRTSPTDVAPSEQGIFGDVALGDAPQHLFIARGMDLAGARPLHPQIVAGESLAGAHRQRRHHRGV